MRQISRVALLCASTLTLSTGIILAPALNIAPAPSAQAGPACPSSDTVYPNLNALPSTGTDDNVNVYVGGDFTTLAGAAEGEGVFVVGGDATFAPVAPDQFNLGIVGVGSQIHPTPLTDMLTTGGSVIVQSSVLDVGFPIGGDIVAGATVTDPPATIVHGGTITENAVDPLAPYAPVAAYYDALSTTFGALAVTGTVASTGWDVTFTGDGSSARQVFTVAGDTLGASPDSKSMAFANIPVGATIIINVTGTAPVVWANSFTFNGAAVDPMSTTSTLFSDVTQRMLWNFGEATSLLLGDGDQLLGSILVPESSATTTLLTSTNGRVYIAGDLVMGGSTQTGLEMHAYPFRDDCGFGAGSGTLSISKSLIDPDNQIASGRSFSGTWACRDSGGLVVAQGAWSLTAGGAPYVSGPVAEGSTCTVVEDTLTPPSADPSYTWAAPVVAPASVTITDATTPSAVTVQNEVRRGVGALEMIKVLDDPFDVVNLDRIYTGSFECSHLGVDVTPSPGTWQTTAGAPALLLATGLPVGTRCTLTEDPLVAPPLVGFPQYIWDTTIISPAVVTITEGVTSRITVTNIVYDPIDRPDAATPELPRTGADLAWPLGLAWLGLGLVLLWIARRRTTSVE